MNSCDIKVLLEQLVQITKSLNIIATKLSNIEEVYILDTSIRSKELGIDIKSPLTNIEL